MTKPSARKRTSYHVGNLSERLMAEARSMLETVGPAKLSIRAISEKLGVSATAAYHHFSNRAALLSRLATQGFRELQQALIDNDQQIEQQGDHRKQLQNASLAYLEFARANPALYQLMFGPEIGHDASDEGFEKARLKAFGELQKIIAASLNEPLESRTVRQASLAAWSHSHGLASLVIHKVVGFPEAMSSERLVETSFQGFEHVFGRSGTPSTAGI